MVVHFPGIGRGNNFIRKRDRMFRTMKKCVHIFVHGLVQGVCFRAYTEKQATNLNLTGWVRNRRDGRVEIMAEGSEPELKERKVSYRSPEVLL